MVKATIHLGYEVPTRTQRGGAAVHIPVAHLAVTGQTQASGKTTTLEALIHRSGLRAVAFITKRGEGSFRTARNIPPYFKDRSDWQFVESILEAAMSQRLKFERSWIIEACRGASSLAQVHAYIKQQITPIAVQKRQGKKAAKKGQPPPELRTPARGLSLSVYQCLDAYFEIVMPQIAALPYTKKLELYPQGINVMDLSAYSTELQGLVIRSVLEWVYEKEENTVVIIPEAWEFIPQGRNSPVRMAAEELIRKGAALHNFIWIDSQDMAGVDKVILRAVRVWIIGVQREANEIDRVLKHTLPLPARPRPEDIMQLGKGEFFACYDKEQHRAYVQPAWIGEAHAQAIAMGEASVESAEKIWREKRKTFAASESAPDGKPVRTGSISGDAADYGAAGRNEQPGPVRDGDGAGLHGPAPARAAVEDGQGDRIATDPLPARVEDYDPAALEEGEIREGIEDAMYQEKFEKVCEILERLLLAPPGEKAMLAWAHKEFARLRDEVVVPSGQDGARADMATTQGPLPVQAQPRPVFDGQLSDELWAAIKARAVKDPGVLEILASRAEIRVKVERPVLQIDGSAIEGRIARLIHEGFFKEGVSGAAVIKELERRGIKAAIGTFYNKLNEITTQGFLFCETQGAKKANLYRAVPGMKVTVE